MLIFFVTGFDDLIVVFALIQEQSRKKRFFVYGGTLLGVIIMFSLSYILSELIRLILINNLESIEQYTQYSKLFLLLPIIFASKIIYENLLKPEQQINKTKKSANRVFWVSLVIYFSNMTDDLTFNTTYLLSLKEFSFVICLFFGNILGFSLMYLFADFSAKKLMNSRYNKLILNLTAVIIIILCLRIILS
ncbi:MAG: hypothetical protein GF365_02195 [Candidatus Buchananbacteria bacterium]|nr:hypothetical protein [Candidatus Buchananbacteria bacterium]